MTGPAWSDLLIEGLPPDVVGRCLWPWQTILSGRVALACMSRFGFSFLVRPRGEVEVLDVFTGLISLAAPSYDVFRASVNDASWRQRYLFPELVMRLHSSGKVAAASQCYALAPHPALGGSNPAKGESVDPRFVTIIDAPVWQSICAQSLGHRA
jgi:hypothetical protein